MQGTQKDGAYMFGSAGTPVSVVSAKHEVNGKAENGAGVGKGAGVEKNDGVQVEKGDVDDKSGQPENFELIPVPYS
jgi:hypothetical protein